MHDAGTCWYACSVGTILHYVLQGSSGEDDHDGNWGRPSACVVLLVAVISAKCFPVCGEDSAPWLPYNWFLFRFGTIMLLAFAASSALSGVP
jgi:hypothetical protein